MKLFLYLLVKEKDQSLILKRLAVKSPNVSSSGRQGQALKKAIELMETVYFSDENVIDAILTLQIDLLKKEINPNQLLKRLTRDQALSNQFFQHSPSA